MRKQIISLTTVVVLLSAALPGLAEVFSTPAALSGLANSTVYCTCQDSTGAVWINSNYGLFRFTGENLERVHSSFPMNEMRYDGADHIYVKGSSSIHRYDIRSFEDLTIPLGLPEDSLTPFTILGGRLVVCYGNKAVFYGVDGMEEMACILDDGVVITAVCTGDDGLIFGCSDGSIMDSGGKTLCSCRKSITALYHINGILYIGHASGFTAYHEDRKTLLDTDDSALGGSSVRSFTKTSSGDLYCATILGLFHTSPDDNRLKAEPVTFMEGPTQPVCQVMADAEGNLWLSTYYEGVLLGNMTTFPFHDISGDGSIKMLKGMVEDCRKDVWVLTDRNGAFRWHEGAWSRIKGMDGIKFQTAMYDSDRDAIWSSEYNGDLLKYDICSGRMTRYPINIPGRQIGTIISDENGEFILGTNGGILRFDPEKETGVSRIVPGYEGQVFSMGKSPDGTLWIGGNGLYRIRRGENHTEAFEHKAMNPGHLRAMVSSVMTGPEGELYIGLLGVGIYIVRGDNVQLLNSSGCGIADNFMSVVYRLDGKHILAETRDGISIIFTDTGQTMNYSSENGLCFSSGRGGVVLPLSDGKIWISGSDGIEEIDPSQLPSPPDSRRVTLEALTVNGKQVRDGIRPMFMDKLVLRHNENNFSFRVATYNYTGTSSVLYSYRLDGFDEDWNSFSPTSAISYMNMSPGSYNLRVRALYGTEERETFLALTILRPWYGTILFKLLMSALVIGIIFWLLYLFYTRSLLRQKLDLSEKEKRTRTKYFVDLSNHMRSPLNIIIGQIERYFKAFGSRAPGIGNLENIYRKATEMRTMIADYADSQNDLLINETLDAIGSSGSADMAEEEKSMEKNVRNAKLLNAATGAVERHLFSGDLNVETLTKELSMSRTSLNDHIREISGMSTREFIEDVRLRHAAKMLEGGGLRISEIASQLGFSSPRYFSDRFRMKFGCNPRDYTNSKTTGNSSSDGRAAVEDNRR